MDGTGAKDAELKVSGAFNQNEVRRARFIQNSEEYWDTLCAALKYACLLSLRPQLSGWLIEFLNVMHGVIRRHASG